VEAQNLLGLENVDFAHLRLHPGGVEGTIGKQKHITERWAHLPGRGQQGQELQVSVVGGLGGKAWWQNPPWR